MTWPDSTRHLPPGIRRLISQGGLAPNRQWAQADNQPVTDPFDPLYYLVHVSKAKAIDSLFACVSPTRTSDLGPATHSSPSEVTCIVSMVAQ